jgi:uncharacterized protein
MIVVDTGAIVASKDEDHVDHSAVAAFLEDYRGDLLLSPLVLAEADYLLNVRLGQRAAQELLGEVASEAYDLVPMDHGDVAAASGICERYEDMSIGVTDASLVIIASNYNTTRLLTLDQKHFRAIKPLWGAPAFRLHPYDD